MNSSLGCPARCTYCYISEYGYGQKPTLASFSGDELRQHLYDNRHQWQQSDYNIISFGCFSESMCKPYIQKTLEFVRAIASFGMPIQIATKWSVSDETVEEFSSAVNYSGQLNIFASLVTLRHWENIEPGTRSPKERISTLLRFKDAGQNTYLYIKPVIPGITDLDAPAIRDIMQENGFDVCVVGALFSNQQITRALQSKVANVASHSLNLHPQATKFQVPGSADLRMAYPVSTLDQVIATLTTNTYIKTFYNSVDATRYKTIPQSLTVRTGRPGMESVAFAIVAWISIGVLLVLALTSALRTVLEALTNLPLPSRWTDNLRRMRVSETTELLRQLHIVQRLRMHQQVTQYQVLPEGDERRSYVSFVVSVAKKYYRTGDFYLGRTYNQHYPAFLDLMSASTEPKDVELLARSLASFIKDETGELKWAHPILFDKIVVPSTGSPILGFVLAQTLGSEVLLFRGDRDPKIRLPLPVDLPDGFVHFNGSISKDAHAILVDDSTTGGGVLADCTERLREIGVQVHHAFVLFEPEDGGARDRLGRKDVTLHSIVKLNAEFRSQLEQ